MMDTESARAPFAGDKPSRPTAASAAASAASRSCLVLGMRLDLLAAEKYLPRIALMAAERRAGYCCVVNVHTCIRTYDDPEYRAVVNGADFVVSDSVVLHRGVKFRYGLETPPAMFGTNIMLGLCEEAERRGIPVALVGGRDAGVLRKLEQALLKKHPRLDIVFATSPPFREPTPSEREGLYADIRASGAGLVIVGLGCPKQERWMAAAKPHLPCMMIGVGAAFDFISENVKPSPPWVHRSGLEWLYRLVSEPRRLGKRYLTTSPRFMALLALDRRRARRHERRK
jgi:N-acetylglucosaminyldiphosphoundecaprenol N-acetyl-beta-D-mannosaminyltransferase